MSRPAPNEALSAYIDGELTEDEARQLEQQLDRDDALRAELDAIQGAVTLLRDHGPVAAPSGFHARVLATVADESPKPSVWQWLRQTLGFRLEGLAVAMVAIVVLLLALPATRTALSPSEVSPGMVSPKMKTVGVDEEQVGSDIQDAEVADPAPEPPATPEQLTQAADSKQEGLDAAPIQEAAPGLASKPSPKNVEKVPQSKPAGKDMAPNAPPVLRNPGFSYTVTTDDPDALIALIRSAEQFSGKLTDVDNQALETIDIPATGERVVIAHLPFQAIGRFSKSLSKLGSVQRVENDKLIRGDVVRVEVTVRMAGGSPKGMDERPKASQRSYKEADVKGLERR